MPITLAQAGTLTRGTGNPLTAIMSLGTVAAGDTVIVPVLQQGSSTRTYTVSDGIVGTYTLLHEVPFVTGDRGIYRYYWYPNHPGGSVVVTVTHGNSSADFGITGGVFAGLGDVPVLELTDKFTDAADDTNHRASTSGLTFASDCLVVVVGTTSGPNFTDAVPSTGYAKLPASFVDTDHMIMWQVFASISAELGSYTTTGTARQMTSAMIVISPDEEPPPPSGGDNGLHVAFIGM